MTIKFDGDTWNVIGTGVNRDGFTFVHLASTTRGNHQHNGFNPCQIGTFVPSKLLQAEAA